MYLSQLSLRPASRQVLRDMASPYELHRTLMRAFPDSDAGGPGRVLFRIEPMRDGGDAEPPRVLVQSDVAPDWSRLPDGYATVQGPKELALALSHGQRLRFRLRANPSLKRDGKRRGLTKEEDQRCWLDRKAAGCGFKPLAYTIVRVGRTISRRGEHGVATHLGADFEGVLQVTDAAKFSAAIRTGIGPAKGFGFGLLSVAKA